MAKPRDKKKQGKKPAVVIEQPVVEQQQDIEARRTRLKALIVLGKERGYLTYAEINDHLPDMLEVEQIEGVVSMINEMGISVCDVAPDTETLIMTDVALSISSLQAIRDMGVTIAIDDFGTGFSSLSYLSKLPVDTLKIDRYFVLTMDKDEGSAKIVKSVVNLGRDLSLEVVAEGVENGELAALLLEAQCHYGQGFGYAPALSPQEAEVYLNEAYVDGAAPVKARG